MKTKWKPIAMQGRRQIVDYILKKFGEIAVKNFILEIRDTIRLLKNNPYMSPIDPLFDDRAKTYRSIFINKRSKMVYYIENDIIQIAGFWDCRCDPVAAAKEVE